MVKTTRSQKVKIVFFAEKLCSKGHRESRQNLKCSVFNSLYISKNDYSRIRMTVSKIGRGQRSERSRHNEIDNNRG